MLARYTLIALVVFLNGCQSKPENPNGGFNQIAPLDTSLFGIATPHSRDAINHAYWDTADGIGVYCEDTTIYSMAFVRCLRSMSLPALLRIENGAINGDGPDPIRIIPQLTDTTSYHFTGSDEDSKAELSITRLNLTSISATFRMKCKDQEPVVFNGICDLGCGFILGAESDDGRDGAYFVDEYWSRDGCYAFRIGMDGDRLSAKVTGTCLKEGNGYVGPQLFNIK